MAFVPEVDARSSLAFRLGAAVFIGACGIAMATFASGGTTKSEQLSCCVDGGIIPLIPPLYAPGRDMVPQAAHQARGAADATGALAIPIPNDAQMLVVTASPASQHPSSGGAILLADSSTIDSSTRPTPRPYQSGMQELATDKLANPEVIHRPADPEVAFSIEPGTIAQGHRIDRSRSEPSSRSWQPAATPQYSRPAPTPPRHPVRDAYPGEPLTLVAERHRDGGVRDIWLSARDGTRVRGSRDCVWALAELRRTMLPVPPWLAPLCGVDEVATAQRSDQ